MKTPLLSLPLLFLACTSGLFADTGRLMRTPTMNETTIVFSYAGDLWRVSRAGGDAERLTSAPGNETKPIFSPDGVTIAFTGEYDGNIDVFAIPAAGGEPRRLTYHPGPDTAIAWTPDGKRILFRSPRNNENDGNRFFTVPVEGGFPTPVLLPLADEGSFSPDGARLAYVPVFHWQDAWKRYQGGQTKPIWIATLSDSRIQPIPRENSNDFNPIWVGDKIYFLSDRNGPISLFEYDSKSAKIIQLLQNSGLDLKSASAGPGGIVYEQFGSIHIYDFKSRKEKPVEIHIAGDFAEVRPHFQKIEAKDLSGGIISPTGARAVFEAHGEIFTLPAEKGDWRNITRSPAVADRTPAWSPDGKRIAWFSDASGEYALLLRDQSGLGETKTIDLGEPHSYFYSPTWSPDSKKIAFTDKWLNLWYVDVDKGTKTKIDTNNFDDSQVDMNPRWAPDSRWVVYTKVQPTFYHAIYLYSLETGKTTQVTDGMSDAQLPVFDKSGKYLYFIASTNLGMAAGGGGANLSSLERPVNSDVYVMVLGSNLPSPLAPESDDEKSDKDKEQGKDKDGKKDEKKDSEPPKVVIDFDSIGQRILALPISAKNYARLWTGKDGILFLWSVPEIISGSEPPSGPVDRFDLSKRKVDKLVDGVREADVSSSGEKILFRQDDRWFITAAETPPKPGDGALNLSSLEVWTEPRAEWKQMYHETWRIERDFLYDPHFHGLNLTEAEEKYAPFVQNLDSRQDLNYLFEEMLGELTLGHVFVRGGTMPEVKKIKTGLLGADYAIENNRYRFVRIYNGENWNPELRAPLTQPGINVKSGEYLLAVQGRNLTGADEVYAFFEETAGKQVTIKVGPNADGSGSRDVTVIPVDNEKSLRHLAWMEDNRRKVYAATKGRVAYVHVPDTAFNGLTSFNRYYFAQSDKEGAIIDERFNHGGLVADYIVDNMNRKILSRITSREGLDVSSPAATIFGPKVMIINQFAGSGGDAMPWYFRKLGIGPLVGHRTWGGLVGIGGYPRLMDGGSVTAPRVAFYGLNGQWEVENHGITPDYDIELDPSQWRLGHDSQLEKAIQVTLELLEKNPPKIYKVPPYPNYQQRQVAGAPRPTTH